MKNQEQIKAKLEWILKEVDKEENQEEIPNIKLWVYYDALKWVLED